MGIKEGCDGLEQLRARLKSVSTTVQLSRIFERLEIEMALLPYYPEMLDFDLKENAEEAKLEVKTYLNSFK